MRGRESGRVLVVTHVDAEGFVVNGRRYEGREWRTRFERVRATPKVKVRVKGKKRKGVEGAQLALI